MSHIDEPLDYQFSLSPNRLSGAESYVTSFTGVARGWDDDAGDERPVGSIRGQRIDLAAAREDGIDRVALLESISPEIADFAAQMLDGDGHCPAGIQLHGMATEGGWCDCLVYIEAIEVEQELRGQHVGTGLLRRCAELLDIHRCLLGLKAFPISNAPGSGRSNAEIQRVKHFYERLGFSRGAGEFMVKNAALCKSTARPPQD